MKKSGPDLVLKKRPLKKCGNCHGNGITKGLFHEMPCGDCLGGYVDAETGEPLLAEDMVLHLSLANRDLREELREVRQRLMNVEGRQRGHGPMGQRYHGD